MWRRRGLHVSTRAARPSRTPAHGDPTRHENPRKIHPTRKAKPAQDPRQPERSLTRHHEARPQVPSALISPLGQDPPSHPQRSVYTGRDPHTLLATHLDLVSVRCIPRRAPSQCGPSGSSAPLALGTREEGVPSGVSTHEDLSRVHASWKQKIPAPAPLSQHRPSAGPARPSELSCGAPAWRRAGSAALRGGPGEAPEDLTSSPAVSATSGRFHTRLSFMSSRNNQGREPKRQGRQGRGGREGRAARAASGADTGSEGGATGTGLGGAGSAQPGAGRAGGPESRGGWARAGGPEAGTPAGSRRAAGPPHRPSPGPGGSPSFLPRGGLCALASPAPPRAPAPRAPAPLLPGPLPPESLSPCSPGPCAPALPAPASPASRAPAPRVPVPLLPGPPQSRPHAAGRVTVSGAHVAVGRPLAGGAVSGRPSALISPRGPWAHGWSSEGHPDGSRVHGRRADTLSGPGQRQAPPLSPPWGPGGRAATQPEATAESFCPEGACEAEGRPGLGAGRPGVRGGEAVGTPCSPCSGHCRRRCAPTLPPLGAPAGRCPTPSTCPAPAAATSAAGRRALQGDAAPGAGGRGAGGGLSGDPEGRGAPRGRTPGRGPHPTRPRVPGASGPGSGGQQGAPSAPRCAFSPRAETTRLHRRRACPGRWDPRFSPPPGWDPPPPRPPPGSPEGLRVGVARVGVGRLGSDFGPPRLSPSVKFSFQTQRCVLGELPLPWALLEAPVPLLRAPGAPRGCAGLPGRELLRSGPPRGPSQTAPGPARDLGRGGSAQGGEESPGLVLREAVGLLPRMRLQGEGSRSRNQTSAASSPHILRVQTCGDAPLGSPPRRPPALSPPPASRLGLRPLVTTTLLPVSTIFSSIPQPEQRSPRPAQPSQARLPRSGSGREGRDSGPRWAVRETGDPRTLGGGGRSSGEPVGAPTGPWIPRPALCAALLSHDDSPPSLTCGSRGQNRDCSESHAG
ncbi:collagen alpha-1(I) chain-like [Hippopotamus amphibius kiboko]|uniref:collagen alpha-1(I) chain-like n=1 Tax=Hippopotamus amphibius kiboko TaxID=575201 RepID=UPI00259A20A5|nr:collagen alpha-1(I) chain-like [Hippopotamus amphibius kiboko]